MPMHYASVDLATRQEIEDVVVRLFNATDMRDWPVVEACFTDPLTLDMSSLVGGEPRRLSPREVTAAWDEGFKPLDHVHHQVSNFVTEASDDTATVHCHGIAFHHRGGIAAAVKTRGFVGTYDFALVRNGAGWRIALLRFNLKFVEGNLELETAQ
jgi:hypothetical protein